MNWQAKEKLLLGSSIKLKFMFAILIIIYPFLSLFWKLIDLPILFS